MKRLCKNILAIVLCISLFIGATLPAFAASEEEYICELRLIYADTYDEAKDILEDSEFENYKLYKENLNEDSGEIGVWLAYKTTTDIEDAITDMAVMQMQGGYNEGNYAEMIKESRDEYNRMSAIYQKAIAYFVTAYDNDDFLAKAAYRQLNFYTAVTDENLGIEIPDFDGELLGDVFYEGIDTAELATIFMEGNYYALDNIRSLLAMGVAYNADGKHYLQKVGESAALMNANASVFDTKDYDSLASVISGTILTFRDMFKELATVEDSLNYQDEEVTDLELKYAEYQSFADRMRDVKYLNDKTLYDFCLDYQLNKNDFSSLYPLVDALNNGQAAMTEALHYYDVVRYSFADLPEEIMDEEIAKLEDVYNEYPFNVYLGVDRSIYYGTFALTSEALRADAYTEDGFISWLMNTYPHMGIAAGVLGGTSIILSIWGICRSIKAGMMTSAANKAVNAAQAAYNGAWDSTITSMMDKSAFDVLGYTPSTGLESAFTTDTTCGELIDDLLAQAFPDVELTDPVLQFNMLSTTKGQAVEFTSFQQSVIKDLQNYVTTTTDASQVQLQVALTEAKNNSAHVAEITGNMSELTVSLYILGGVLMLITAIQLGMAAIDYYNPNYDDIPVALVDLIETEDGDRYIKYDAVLEAETRERGDYVPGDLNAFEALRWNALYYTKSYDAGKPLLADEFSVSNTNNKPRTNYTPVHRFGEVVCYDLNKYNYDDDTSIYLSVKQSKKDKAAVADVPQVVGSMFSNGFWILAAGAGALIGVGGTLGTQLLLKKKKSKAQ